jgi:hypothetical protein
VKKTTVDITVLLTVKNYADNFNVTAAYIYKLVKEERMSLYEIDGVKFVRTDVYPVLPVANRRK